MASACLLLAVFPRQSACPLLSLTVSLPLTISHRSLLFLAVCLPRPNCILLSVCLPLAVSRHMSICLLRSLAVSIYCLSPSVCLPLTVAYVTVALTLSRRQSAFPLLCLAVSLPALDCLSLSACLPLTVFHHLSCPCSLSFAIFCQAVQAA